MPLDIKKRMEEYSKSVIDTFYAQQFTMLAGILPTTENRNVGLRFRFSFSAFIRLSSFEGERINSIDFSYDLLSQKGKKFLMKEKYEKFPNRFFPPTMMMMKIKEKLMKSLL